MTSDPSPVNTATDQPPTSAEDSIWLAMGLRRSNKVVLVVDLMESVRLMEDDEALAVTRWRAFLMRVTGEVLPATQGRLVKSLGDGLMLEFEHPRQAASAAKAMHDIAATISHGCPPEQTFALRVGAHSAEVYADDIDIYGAGVNLAARLASLAGPGETVVSCTVRDELTDGLDVEVEDLGECYLKHVAQPVRAWKLHAHASHGELPPKSLDRFDLPVLAVIPFRPRLGNGASRLFGELAADLLILQFSQLGLMRVISRFSTSAIQQFQSPVLGAEHFLGANWAVAGEYQLIGSEVQLYFEVIEVASRSVVTAEHMICLETDTLRGDSPLVATVVSATLQAMVQSSTRRAQTESLPNLHGAEILLAATANMRGTDPASFLRVRDWLGAVRDRHPRLARAQALLANWHTMRVAQAWSPDPSADTAAALQLSARALDLSPGLASAWSIRGVVLIHSGEYEKARAALTNALSQDGSDMWAHLYLGLLATFEGSGPDAVVLTGQARALSPIDPALAYVESLQAGAYLTDQQYGRALDAAKSAVRRNRMHTPAHRVLCIAQALSGDVAAARLTAQHILRLAPTYTVSAFRQRSRFAAPGLVESFASALAAAGIPNQ